MDWTVSTSDTLSTARREALWTLWQRAFHDFTADDADHAYGGVHVIAWLGDRPVAHASAVPRRLRFGDGPWREVGYVEAVAVDPDHQGTGLGRRLLLALHDEIDTRWPLAMLSTGRATGFYERLGWQRWEGLSYTATADGVVADDEHGGLMVRRSDPAELPDVGVDVVCEDRAGDAW